LFCLFDPGDSECEGGFSREQQLMAKLKKHPVPSSALHPGYRGLIHKKLCVLCASVVKTIS
jgi:hypothetical protein